MLHLTFLVSYFSEIESQPFNFLRCFNQFPVGVICKFAHFSLEVLVLISQWICILLIDSNLSIDISLIILTCSLSLSKSASQSIDFLIFCSKNLTQSFKFPLSLLNFRLHLKSFSITLSKKFAFIEQFLILFSHGCDLSFIVSDFVRYIEIISAYWCL